MVKLEALEQFAKKNKIPIMQKEGIEYLINYIKNNNIISILEIGTAIGYSSIKMALADTNITITTIERNVDMYKEAFNNIKNFNLEKQITVIYNDAFNVELNTKYDLIFIDAAKSQNIRFFNKFKYNLNIGGTIITDNLKFHGLVNNPNLTQNRNTKQMINKIKKYITFLKENTEYTTVFLDIGDGLSISKKN